MVVFGSLQLCVAGCLHCSYWLPKQDANALVKALSVFNTGWMPVVARRIHSMDCKTGYECIANRLVCIQTGERLTGLKALVTS